MKKVFICLLLALGFMVFFACASPPPPEPVPAPAPEVPPAPPPPAPPPAEPPVVVTSPARTTDLILDGASTHVVVWGDTLSRISRRRYNNGFYYPLIMMASRDIVRNQDVIIPGMVLTIPVLQANLDDPRARESMKTYFMEVARITERRRPRDARGLRALAGSL